MRKSNPLISDDSVNAILEIASAYQKSKILLTACELDIFSALGDEMKTSKEVAFETETDERAIDRLMNALCHLQLLTKHNDKFSNTKGTRRFLVHGSSEYLGRLMHLTHIWDKWGTLTEAVKKGTAVVYDDITDKDEEWIKSFINSMHSRGRMQAPDIIREINFDGINKVLDLGCGSGLYAIEMAKAKPSLDISVFDLPVVIDHTKEHLKEAGFENKIKTMPGDFHKDDIGEGYDLVFISSVIHFNSLWENVALMKKVYDSLNLNGMAVIQEQVVNDSRTDPADAVNLALNMLVNTKGGDSYTETDLWIVVKEAWFRTFKFYRTEFGTSLITCRK